MWTAVKETLRSPKGRLLLMAGMLFVFVGTTNIITADEVKPNLPSYQAYAAQFSLFNGLEWWGAFFVVSGVAAIVAAFWTRFRYVGFFSLMLMSMWWAGLYGASLLMTGYTRIIPSIFTWSLISVFLSTISSWQEVPRGKE